MNRTSLVRLSAVVFLVLLLLGTLPPGYAAAAGPFDGDWSGTTAEGSKLGFTVENGVLTSYFIEVSLSQCGHFYFMATGETPVTKSGFTIESKDAEVTIAFEGVFGAAGKAEGALMLAFSDYVGCTGKLDTMWQVSRQGASSSTPTPTPTRVATATSAPTRTPAAPSGPTAVVAAASLNVRSGPGLAYSVIASVRRNAALSVTGQSGNCAWLKVKLAKGEGWVASGPQYAKLNTACSAIPAASAPPPPTPKPTSAASAGTGAAASLEGAPVHVDLLNADAATIGATLLGNSRFYLPLAKELEGMMGQDRGSCPRLVQLVDTFTSAPRYRELADMLWKWRRERPSQLEQRIYEFLDIYSAGIDPFMHESFKNMRASCQQGQWPSADLRQQGLTWATRVGGSGKFETVVTYLPGLMSQ